MSDQFTKYENSKYHTQSKYHTLTINNSGACGRTKYILWPRRLRHTQISETNMLDSMAVFLFDVLIIFRRDPQNKCCSNYIFKNISSIVHAAARPGACVLYASPVQAQPYGCTAIKCAVFRCQPQHASLALVGSKRGRTASEKSVACKRWSKKMFITKVSV